jgi:hypothetical protein
MAEPHLSVVQPRLDKAEEACAPSRNPLDWIDWFTGAAQERSWLAIHEADVSLTHLASDERIVAELPVLRQTIRELVKSDVHKEELLDETKEVETEPSKGRETVARLKQELYELSDDGYERKRSFRNIVLTLTLVLAIVAAMLAIPGWFDPMFRPLLQVKGWAPPIWQVELVGALGGLLVAVVAVKKLESLRGPYSLPFVQAALKIPMGALTGLIGMVLVQSKEFGVGPAQKTAFFGWVLLFGAAQELLTQLVDKKATAVVKEAKPGA